jgi:hypothetical protein
VEIGWLIKVLRNGCFHNGPVICPRLSHNGPRKVVLALGNNLGHMTGLKRFENFIILKILKSYEIFYHFEFFLEIFEIFNFFWNIDFFFYYFAPKCFAGLLWLLRP